VCTTESIVMSVLAPIAPASVRMHPALNLTSKGQSATAPLKTQGLFKNNV